MYSSFHSDKQFASPMRMRDESGVTMPPVIHTPLRNSLQLLFKINTCLYFFRGLLNYSTDLIENKFH